MFSAVMFGATLLYNVLLARACALEDVEDYQDDFRTWAKGNCDRGEFTQAQLERWSLDELRIVAIHPAHRIAPQAWLFVQQWTSVARGDRAAILDRADAAELVIAREHSLKLRRARPTDPEARAGWGGQSGYAPLNYRWGLVRRYLEDFAA